MTVSRSRKLLFYVTLLLSGNLTVIQILEYKMEVDFKVIDEQLNSVQYHEKVTSSKELQLMEQLHPKSMEGSTIKPNNNLLF